MKKMIMTAIMVLMVLVCVGCGDKRTVKTSYTSNGDGTTTKIVTELLNGEVVSEEVTIVEKTGEERF